MPISLKQIDSLSVEEVANLYSPKEIDDYFEKAVGPGFLDRLQSGFATSPEGEVSILSRS